MERPTYDKQALQNGIKTMQGEINAHLATIEELKRRIGEYKKHLTGAEDSNNGRPD